MKKVVMGVMVAIMAVSIGLSSAEAKRMGSGGSVGKQSQSVNQSGSAQSAQSPAAMQSAAPARPGATPAAAAPKPASPWKGMLGGALLGSYRYAQRHGLLRPEHAAVGRALMRRLGLMQVQYAAAAGLCLLNVPAGAGLLLLVQLNYALGLVADRWLGD